LKGRKTGEPEIEGGKGWGEGRRGKGGKPEREEEGEREIWRGESEEPSTEGEGVRGLS
jgi:hypothetical protein